MSVLGKTNLDVVFRMADLIFLLSLYSKIPKIFVLILFCRVPSENFTVSDIKRCVGEFIEGLVE